MLTNTPVLPNELKRVLLSHRPAPRDLHRIQYAIDAALERCGVSSDLLEASGWVFQQRGLRVGYFKAGAWQGSVDLDTGTMNLPR